MKRLVLGVPHFCTLSTFPEGEKCSKIPVEDTKTEFLNSKSGKRNTKKLALEI